MVKAVGKFEDVKKLKGKLSSRAVAKRFGMHHATVARWWQRVFPPRVKFEPVTLEHFGFQRCEKKRCGRCGGWMMVQSLDGRCAECTIVEEIKSRPG